MADMGDEREPACHLSLSNRRSSLSRPADSAMTILYRRVRSSLALISAGTAFIPASTTATSSTVSKGIQHAR